MLKYYASLEKNKLSFFVMIWKALQHTHILVKEKGQGTEQYA